MFRNEPVFINDTTAKLWETLYKVRVPYQLTRSIADIEKYGTPITGNHDVDNSTLDDWITTMKPVSDIVDLFMEGKPVALVNREDMKTIYQDIQDHIYAWKKKLEVGVNIGDAPIEDLIAMDEFAEIIHNLASKEVNAGLSDSLIVRQLGVNSIASARNFFSGDALAKITGKVDTSGTLVVNGEDDDTEVRDGLGEFFKSRSMNING